jgi:hypothetical protein
MTSLLTPGPFGAVGVVVVAGVVVVVWLVVVEPVPPELGGVLEPLPFFVPGLVFTTGVGFALGAAWPADVPPLLTATGAAGVLPPLGVGAADTAPLLGAAASELPAGVCV